MILHLHPLFTYTTILLGVLVFVLYLLGLTLLKNTQALRYALILNGVFILFSLLSVFTGFSASGNQLVQSKAPSILLFPHKWIGFFILLYSLIAFLIFWFKGDNISKKVGILISLLGLFIVLFQFLTGILLRRVFFGIEIYL